MEAYQVVVKEVGKNFEKMTMHTEDLLEGLQTIVGGYIEVLPVYDFVMVVNEEGKLRNMPVNFLFQYGKGNVLGIRGTVVFIGRKDDELVSLEDEQVEKIFKLYKEEQGNEQK